MKLVLGLFLILCCSFAAKAEEGAKSCVILLHGLARSPASMRPVENKLLQAGYPVVNFGYDSTDYSIEELAVLTVEAALDECELKEPAHFVTHSMGGILLRRYAFEKGDERIDRVVMLGPPNQGSETVDHLGDLWLFDAINGPAGAQLGTAADSMPNSLGPVGFELGVIAGTKSFNPLFSYWLAGNDDGKVAVARAKVAGMTAFRTIPNTHTFMMSAEVALDEILYFLRTGRFECAGDPTEEDEEAVCELQPFLPS